MPQADLSYSAHLSLDAPAILARIETVISTADEGAGQCKGRAMPVLDTHHDHVLLRIRTLEKPHRNGPFMNALRTDLEDALRSMVPAPCILGIELGFLSPYYGSTTLT